MTSHSASSPSPASSKSPARSKSRSPAPLASAPATLRILMIEDDKYYCQFVQQLLLRRTNPKYQVKLAGTLNQAVACLQKENPDVILLDLNLPDGNGLMLLDKVKEYSDSCPIVILTSADDDAMGLKAVAAGAHDYLVKQNIGNDSLVRCIRYAIERRRAEEQTLRLAVIQDFIGTLAHDMRVPLLGATKLLNALLAGSVGTLSATQEQVVKTLQESNDNQLQLVHRLLEVYRYESGSSSLSPNILDLSKLIQKSIEPRLPDSQTAIVFKNLLPDKKGLIQGDEEALMRLFANLIDNAIKFSDKDKPITVTASTRGTNVAIDVHNFGHTIPQDIQDNLFQTFWQGVPGKRYVAHTGLGLYLCHRIVQLHQGRIACHSQESEGTTISVVLPGLLPEET